jgi:large subunit ribosomal protein L17
MRHRKAGRKYSRTREHKLAMFRNLLMNLIRYSRIKTTDAKAKGLRQIADKVINLAKKKDLNNIRKASYYVPDKDLLKKLFSEIGPKFANRNGGYTRIYKIGVRQGDAAPLSMIEFAFEEDKKTKKPVKKATPKPKKEAAKKEGEKLSSESTAAPAEKA